MNPDGDAEPLPLVKWAPPTIRPKAHRHRGQWKARLAHIGRGLWRFLGPVHNSVKGMLTDAEFRRVGTKMVVMWITTATPTIDAVLKDPENLTLFFIPLVAAILCGIFDAAFHLQTGDQPPAVPTPPEEKAAP